jgi:hypothetical protein
VEHKPCETLAFTAAASDQMRPAQDGLVALNAMATARKNVEATSERKTRRLAVPAKPLRMPLGARSVMAGSPFWRCA